MPCILVGFPTGRDSTAFRDNGTEVSSLSRDKGTTVQAQNLAKGQDGPGQPVKIRDRTRDRIRDGTVPDFDSLSRPVPQDKTGQSRKGHSKTGKGRSKTDLFVGVVTPEDHT